MKPVNRIFFMFALLSWIHTAAWSQDPGAPAEPPEPEPVLLRSSLDPESTVLVGQKVRLYVDVLTNTWFTKAPQYPELRIPHAVCLELSQFGTNYSERIQGETYAVQRKEYVIYPQRAARYTVPSLAVEITYARPGESPGVVTLETSTLAFESRIPEKALDLDHFVCTPRLNVREQYDSGFEGLKVGDSVTRTITMTAEDSVGMMLPPLDFSGMEGVSLYPKAPRTENTSNRGEYIGTRVESVTYIMEAEGEYILPEIQIFWYDLNSQDLRTEVLEAVEFSVGPNPDLDAEMLASLEPEEAGEDETAETGKKQINVRNLVYLILAILGILTALGMFVLPTVKRLGIWWKHRKQQKAGSEERYFREFRRACRSRDAHRIMQDILGWLDKIYPGPGAATLDEFVCRADDMELRALAGGLEEKLYRGTGGEEPSAPWPAADFYSSVAMARKRLLNERKTKAKAPGLRPLNP